MSKIKLTIKQREYLKSLLKIIELEEGDDILPVQDEINVIKEVFRNGYVDTDMSLNTWAYTDARELINSWKQWYLNRVQLLQK